MQNKIQVNQVLREFSRYGMLLYILAAIFFYQTILITFYQTIFINHMNLATNSFPLSFYSTFRLIELISEGIIAISIMIVVFILMLKAIKIHSKVHEPSIKLFSVFSVLWFIFYIIAQIIIWLLTISSIIAQSSNNPTNLYTGYHTLNYIQSAAGILSTISQLIVWISLRKFFLDNDDIFPIKTTRSILICLIILMITMCSILLSESIMFNIYYTQPVFSTNYQLFAIPSGILSIIGYSLLGYRLRKVKTSLDTTIPER